MRNHFTLSMIFFAAPAVFGANQYVQHNLVSDIPGMADQTDANLVNPWGISFSPTSPFWISNNHSGTTSVYDATGKPALTVGIPAPPNGAPPASPTGQVYNDTTGFVLSGKPASFIFSTEDGTISGWNSSADPKNAVILVDNSSSGAVYKGIAVANTSNGPMLFAANFNAGTIDVFDSNLSPAATSGGFADAALPAGYAPFNIARIGQKLYVTYAVQDDAKHDDVPGAGNGLVDVFDFNGNLLVRLIANGALNSPWGLAMAPSNFGDFSNTLLVGNFGDGTLNAFDPCSGAYIGTLADRNGAAIAIQGLWALVFGNGHNGGDATILYFTAGIPGGGNLEDHGLFGSLQPAALAPAPPQTPQSVAVNIANFAFAPPSIDIAAGTQITWTNMDGAAHTVVSDDSKFTGSNPVSQNQSFSQTFSTPGTYAYHCSIHPFMKGTVVVK